MWANSSTDALVDAPVPMATKRSRRLALPLRIAVGKALATGEVGRTGGRVAKSLQRFRKWGHKRFGATACANAVSGRVRSYIREAKGKLNCQFTRHISVACDGTRMAGRDVFYAALFAPELDVACWCPPQVFRLHWNTKKIRQHWIQFRVVVFFFERRSTKIKENRR